MPLLNDVIRRKTEIKKKNMDDIISETSKIMRGVFKGNSASIDNLITSTFALGKLTSEAFRLRCCDPKSYDDIDKTLNVYMYVSGMLGECGGALQHELIGKYGPEAEIISQKLVELAIRGDKTKREANKFIFDMIEEIKKEEDDYDR